MFSKTGTIKSMQQSWEQIAELKEQLETADAILLGAGSGLSASVGLLYNGKRFQEYFADFIEEYHFRDMYSAGFYPFDTLEEYWGYWSRHIFYNRYVDIPNDLYQILYALLKDKNYFILTTNVDHCFQRAGFDQQRLFYTQGDYGLFQCSKLCHQQIYDNKLIVRQMVMEQKDRKNPNAFIPCCPKCAALMSVNLHCDNTFVQDSGWYNAARRYQKFMERYRKEHILYRELGVGENTPVLRSLRTRNQSTKTLRKRRISGHLQILTTNYEERRCA